MKGSREDWAEIAPVLTAFIEGKPVQVRGYDGRWKDTDTMRDLLSARGSHRLKPEQSIKGT